MQIYSICVGKRQGATKLEARGMFKGAKVTRGPDWEWKEQDNPPPMEGEVTEVTSWSDETNNDAVRVNWNKGPRGNIYRLGTNGKVSGLLNYCFIIIVISIIIIAGSRKARNLFCTPYLDFGANCAAKIDQ